jgi:hypothetical protein
MNAHTAQSFQLRPECVVPARMLIPQS